MSDINFDEMKEYADNCFQKSKYKEAMEYYETIADLYLKFGKKEEAVNILKSAGLKFAGENKSFDFMVFNKQPNKPYDDFAKRKLSPTKIDKLFKSMILYEKAAKLGDPDAKKMLCSTEEDYDKMENIRTPKDYLNFFIFDARENEKTELQLFYLYTSGIKAGDPVSCEIVFSFLLNNPENLNIADELLVKVLNESENIDNLIGILSSYTKYSKDKERRELLKNRWNWLNDRSKILNKDEKMLFFKNVAQEFSKKFNVKLPDNCETLGL